MQYLTEYNKFKSTQQKIDDLVYAAGTSGNLNIIEIILSDLDEGAVNMKSSKGEIALNAACRNGRKDIVEKLLDAGADVNAQDKDLNTPLMKAIYNNDLELVEMLIQKNANINMQNKWGKTALMLATTSYNRQPNIEIIKRLLDTFPDVFLKDTLGDDFVQFVKTNPVVSELVDKEYGWLKDSPKFGL